MGNLFPYFSFFFTPLCLIFQWRNPKNELHNIRMSLFFIFLLHKSEAHEESNKRDLKYTDVMMRVFFFILYHISNMLRAVCAVFNLKQCSALGMAFYWVPSNNQMIQ